MSSETTKNETGRSCAPALSREVLVPVFFRSFFIEAGWNFERFQNLGFVFSLMPALRKMHKEYPSLKAAVLRHLSQFNTQPYMAGFVMGNVIRMEEELAGGPAAEGAEKKLIGVKAALASGFAAIGDRLFLGRLKPLTTQLCILIWSAAGFYGWLFTRADAAAPSMGVLLCGPLAGMAVYSFFAVYLRWTGLKRGYACGGSSSCGLDALNWQKLIKVLSVSGFALSSLIVLGAFALLLRRTASGGQLADLARAAVPVLAVMALQRAVRKFGRSIFFATGIVIAASLAVSIFSDPGGFGFR